MQTHFKIYQRQLRKNMPSPEILLWHRIRQKQLGVKFRRQYTVDNRILDFYAPQIKLGIEIDGQTHFNSDRQRISELANDQKLFDKYQIKIIRFLNTEVSRNLIGVLMKIQSEIGQNPPPSPSPFYERGRETAKNKKISSANLQN